VQGGEADPEADSIPLGFKEGEGNKVGPWHWPNHTRLKSDCMTVMQASFHAADFPRDDISHKGMFADECNSKAVLANLTKPCSRLCLMYSDNLP